MYKVSVWSHPDIFVVEKLDRIFFITSVHKTILITINNAFLRRTAMS